MKQTLALKLGQQLTMTPQLQQAIRLLQLSALDLQQEIQTTLDSNPLLELTEEGYDEATPEGTEDSLAEAPEGEVGDIDLNDQVGAEEPEQQVSDQLDEPISEDLPVDSSWEDVYPTGSSAGVDSDFDPMVNQTAEQTLADHLLWQLNLSHMAPSDRLIAEAIVDAIEPSGLLGATTEEIWQSLVGPSTAEGVTPEDPESDESVNHEEAEDRITHEDVLSVLELVQELDPVGVGARSLQECLILQLDQLSARTPWQDEARVLIDAHLELLGSKDFTTLKRKTKFSDEALANAMSLIRTLNPRPGNAIYEAAADYIVPDVIVRKFEGRWLVELNSDATPQIRINPFYEGMLKETKKGSDKVYLRDNLQEARWFLKSLQTRHDTLLRVASKIVEVQRGFLEYGPEAMKPLILAEIAEAVDLHESTISRVTSRKYMATPRGVFELKYFFSSHVGTASGGEVSSTAIRALIAKLTAEENPKKPLSDNKIAAILKAQKINVARRTVAKYRESMSIPPSNERKQLV